VLTAVGRAPVRLFEAGRDLPPGQSRPLARRGPAAAP
jgi:hypothetical protein